MTNLTLTKTRLYEGVWEGVLTREGEGNYQPDIEVTHLNQQLSGIEVTEHPDHSMCCLLYTSPSPRD